MAEEPRPYTIQNKQIPIADRLSTLNTGILAGACIFQYGISYSIGFSVAPWLVGWRRGIINFGCLLIEVHIACLNLATRCALLSHKATLN